MNYFVFAGGVLWIGGAFQAYAQGNKTMVIVSICYAVAQFALAFAGGK
jgi:hypothetical protein